MGVERIVSKNPRKNPKLHTQKAPKGYVLKGVSTLLDSDGKVSSQWLKTTRAPMEPKDIRKIYSKMCADLQSAHKPVPLDGPVDEDLCCIYPLGDPHFGSLCWWRETGGKSWDLKIAQETHLAAITKLVDIAPRANIAVLANLGDLIHADGYKGTTYAGTPVDTDGRWPKILRAATGAMVTMVTTMLAKHELVLVESVRGNHDEQSSIVVAEILRAHFRSDPRVIIRDNVRVHTYQTFGKCMFGFHHGDKTKAANLPLLMATDEPALWGSTEHRMWYTGHVHHETRKEFPGCDVETFGTLAPQDAWHAGQGYRAKQRARVDVWHKQHGRVARYEVMP